MSSLIDLVASRLALRAPALRAATTLTRPNRSAQRLPCGRHSVPTAKTVGQDRGFRAIAPPSQVRRDCLLISNASCGLGGFGCAAHAVRKMSLPSPQSRRTWLAKLVGSTATSGQCISCVADAMCQCPLISVTAPQRADGENPSEGSRQCYNRSLLQQYRHKAVVRCDASIRSQLELERHIGGTWTWRDHAQDDVEPQFSGFRCCLVSVPRSHVISA